MITRPDVEISAAICADDALRHAREGRRDAWQAALHALTVAAHTDDAATCTALVAISIAERNDGQEDAARRWATAARDWSGRCGIAVAELVQHDDLVVSCA